MKYTLVNHNGESTVTVFDDNGKPHVAHGSNPQWAEIKRRVVAEENNVIELIDQAEAASKKFERLSERLTAKFGKIYLDGDEISNGLTDQIVRFLANGDDFGPLVQFLEKILSNPQKHSQEQLWRWLDKHKFTLTKDGDIVGYKGVRQDAQGRYVSIHKGKATVFVSGSKEALDVDGEVPNDVGSIVEMARSGVVHDPAVGCSFGLHVGTWDYAKSFGEAAKCLQIYVNPRDVVSVPTDSNDQKIRCCRYYIAAAVDKPEDAAVIEKRTNTVQTNGAQPHPLAGQKVEALWGK